MNEDDRQLTVDTLPVTATSQPGATRATGQDAATLGRSEPSGPSQPAEPIEVTRDLPPSGLVDTAPGGTMATLPGRPNAEAQTHASTPAKRRPPAKTKTNPETKPETETEPKPKSKRVASEPVRRLSHYAIVGELGRGGMGVVYAARDDKLDRKVAIKQLRARGNSAMRRRLVREAQAMAKLSHPNVVPVYEIGELGDTTFIVMEYVEGATLRQWASASPRSQDEILAVFKAAARGLIAAHAKDLIHRDFKPDNVMLGDDGRVRVMDFGLARLGLDADEPDADGPAPAPSGSAFDRLTQTGALLGTPAYMPPEQLRGEVADAASDQFSYCVALYEALYGQRPYVAKTLEQLREATSHKQIREPPPHATVPAWLREIVLRGLEPESEARFESMQVMLDALVAGELAAASEGREPPAYVFVAHDSADKQAVLRLSQGLLDHGVRPWLDMWDLQPGAAWRPTLEHALTHAPALLLCHGPGAWDLDGHEYAQALRARIERDPSTVYRVGLPGASHESLPVSDDCEGVDLHAERWDDGVVELAALIGVDLERADWLTREAEQAGLAEAELCPYRGLEAFRERDARWMFGRDEEVGELLELIQAGETRFLTVIGASGSGKSSLVMAGVCPALRNGVLDEDRDWVIASLRPGAQPCESLAHALVELWDASGSARGRDEQLAFEPLREDLLAHHQTLPVQGSSLGSGASSGADETSPNSPNPPGGIAPQRTMLEATLLPDGGARAEPEPVEREPTPAPHEPGLAVEGLRDELLANRDMLRTLVSQIRARSDGQRPVRILLVIDQLEELFTEAGLGGDEPSPEAIAFVRNLLEATASANGLWIVATLRADFVQRCLEFGELAHALKGGTYFALPPMGEQQIRAAIERPAKRVGFDVEPKLVEKLVASAAGQAGRLPLLQHVLRELWQARDTQRRRLPFAAYAQTGGLEGAIARAAERALDGLQRELGERALLVTRRTMTRLVHLGTGTSGDTRRRARIDELGTDADTRRVLEAFVSQARVLVASEEHGVELFELAHEALLREWTTFVDWLDADREALHMRQELAKDAGQRQGQDDREFLWGRSRVEEARRVLAASVVELNTLERGFLDESEQAVRARARRVRGAVVGFMLTALVVVLVVLQKNSEIETQSEEISAKKLEVEQKNAILEDKERKQQDSLSTQRGLRAQMLIPEDRESEALLLGVQAVGVYGPDWSRPPPAQARAGLELVLANDAIIVAPRATFSGHENHIRSLAYSPDGAHIASASEDKTARIWDAKTGERLAALEGHTDAVHALAYSPDGGRLATVSKDGSARLWDATSGEPLAVLDGHTGPVVALVYSPDGARLLTGSKDRTARIWDATSGEALATLEGHTRWVGALAYSPNGARVVTGSFDGSARLWDADSGELLANFTAGEGPLFTLAYAPDGARLATGGDDGVARIWDLDTHELLASLKGHSETLVALAYAPNGARLATASFDDTARLWDTTTHELLAVLEGHTNDLRTLTFSPDGAQLATASDDATARIWDVGSGRQLTTLEGHNAIVDALAYSPKGTQLATAGFDHRVRVWSPDTANPIATHEGHQDFVHAMAFSPDGVQVATASRDHSARIWDGRSGRQLRTLAGHEKAIQALVYAPNGARLATASFDNTARIWNAETGEPVATLEGHEKFVVALAYSPDGARLASASWDGSARVWDADSGEALARLEGHENRVLALAYAPDGAQIATASRDKTARIWDANSGQQLALLEGHELFVNAVAFSPDGARVATASNDGTARIWNTATGEQLARLDGHEGAVRTITYSHDGARVFSSGEDRSIRIWNPDSGEQLALLEGHLGAVTKLVAAPDGARIGSVSVDRTAKIWDPITGELLTDLKDRIGLLRADGSIDWPASPSELTRIGCQRLYPFTKAYDQAVEVCTPVLAR